MTRREGFLVCLLAASIVANVVLLARSPDSSSSASQSDEVAPLESAVGPAPLIPGAPDFGAGNCPERLQRCLAYVAQQRPGEDPGDRVPLSESFEGGEPSDETTARFKPWLDDIFSESTIDHSVECRASVCRLSMVLGAQFERSGEDPNRVFLRLQSRDGTGGEICGWHFGTGQPGKDPVSGEAVAVEEAYFRVCSEESKRARTLLRQLLEQFDESGAVDECRSKHGERGRLIVRLDADGHGASGVNMSVGGELAQTPVGDCVERALRELASDVVIPEQTEPAVVFREIDL